MVELKLVIADPKTKRTYKAELKDRDAEQLVGKKIGENFRGELINLPGFEMQITGGSDKAGCPMLATVQGAARKRLLLEDGKGFHAERKGERRRKSVRGNMVAPDTVQLNCKIIKYGSEDLKAKYGPTKKEVESAAKAAEAAAAQAQPAA